MFRILAGTLRVETTWPTLPFKVQPRWTSARLRQFQSRSVWIPPCPSDASRHGRAGRATGKRGRAALNCMTFWRHQQHSAVHCANPPKTRRKVRNRIQSATRAASSLACQWLPCASLPVRSVPCAVCVCRGVTGRCAIRFRARFQWRVNLPALLGPRLLRPAPKATSNTSRLRGQHYCEPQA